MMMVQTPAPLAPPANLMPEWVPAFIAVLLLITVSAWLLMPLVRAFAKRIENNGMSPNVLDELTQLRERVAELELHATHSHEIEERLDFAERLLAQRNDAAQLP